MRVALTIDVEGDFGTDALRGVDEVMPRLLGRFAEERVTATLFIVGAVARKRPQMIRDWHIQGHVIASHTMSHPNIRRLDSDACRRELADSKAALEDIAGCPCDGFRAPYYDPHPELGPLLAETGYRWSSSRAPFSPTALYRHYRPGMRSRQLAPGIPEHPVPGFWGLPLPETLSYRRLFWPLTALPASPPGVFTLHPYELLDEVSSYGHPRWWRPFLSFRMGGWAEGLLWRLVGQWRAQGAEFAGLV